MVWETELVRVVRRLVLKEVVIVSVVELMVGLEIR